MILLHCELEKYDGIFLIHALSSEVKADVNFPLYQLSVKIVDIFFYPLLFGIIMNVFFGWLSEILYLYSCESSIKK